MIALSLRGLAQRRLRTLLSGLAILLGVAMIAGTFVETDQVKRAFHDIEQTAYQGRDVVVTSQKAFQADFNSAAPTFSASIMQEIARVPGVRRVEGDLYQAGSLVLGGKRVGSQYAPGMVVSDLHEPFDPARYVRGAKPQPGEVAINRKVADDENLRVGQTVQVATRTGVQEVRLSGVFDYGDVASIGGATMIVAPTDDVQRWYDLVGQVNSVAVAGERGVSPEALARDVRAVVGSGLRVRTGSAEATQQAKEINDAIGSFLTPMLLALAGAGLLVGAFIIFNTFSITVAQRVREFALLRSIGATRRQLVAGVLGEAVVLGGVASALGLGAGLGFAAGLGALFDAAGFGIPRSGLVMEPRTVIVGLAVGVGVTVLAALAPALRATRVAPVVALSGVTPQTARRSRWAPWVAGLVSVAGLAMLLTGLFSDAAAETRMASMAGGAVLVFVGIALSARWFVRPVAAALGLPIERLFKMPGRLARENAQRNPGRTATTSAALMVGVGLVVFVAVFAAGLKASVDRSMDELFKADYVIAAANVEPLPAGAEHAIARTPGVDTYLPLLFDRVQVNGRPVNTTTDTVEGVDGRLAEVYSFKWIDGDDGLIERLAPGQALIEQQFAKTHGLDVGDAFSIRTPSGGSMRVTAVGSYDDPQLIQGVMITARDFRAISASRDPYFYFVARDPRASAEAVGDALKRSLERFPAAEVKTDAEYREDIQGRLDQMVNMLYALLAMSVLISLFGLANSLFLSIHERTREFGLLRAIGATGAQVKRVVRYESVITSALGGMLGTAVGLLFAWLMTKALEDLGFAFSVPVGQLAGFLVVALLVGVVGAVLPARRGARINVLEALRHE